MLLVGPTVDSFPGGIAVQADRLTRALNATNKVRVEQQSIAPRFGGVVGALQRIPVVRTLVTNGVYLAQVLGRLRGFDVVHVNSARFSSFLISSLPAVCLARVAGKPVILNYRNGDLRAELRRYRLFRHLLRLPNTIVVPSGFLEEVLTEVGIAATVVSNQVDLSRFVFRRRDPIRPVFLSVRHFEPYYDVPTIVRAFALLKARFPDARLIVAGKGSGESAVRQLVADLGLADVEFLGQVAPADMPSVYDRADVLLNSSRVDNMPGSLIEAFGSGLAIASTNAGGIPYIVTHGETGLLVPIGDSAALAAAAVRLLEDQALVNAMTERGREEAARRYSWASVEAGWLQVYRSALGRHE